MATLKLGIQGFEYTDLHDPQGLERLFQSFLKQFQKQVSPELFQSYEAYLKGCELSSVDESDLLTQVAPYVSVFIVELFGIQNDIKELQEKDTGLKHIFLFKRDFFQRRALKKYPTPDDVSGLNLEQLSSSLQKALQVASKDQITEEALADFVLPLLESEKDGGLNDQETQSLEDIEAWVCIQYHVVKPRDWVSFVVPRKLDFSHLVETEAVPQASDQTIQGPAATYRRRDGFALTDERMTAKMAMGEVDYCIYCHGRDKDSCSKGLVDKKTKSVTKNALGIDLKGCPLDEKISEAHLLRKQGDSLAALSVIMIDNPMCPGTGHRICNDCMKSCIFQKQDPVNIPQIETNILTQVLNLPFGFEVYGLLSRFNPLNRKRPYALPYNGKNVLVVGMGPAGYTLSHYLLNEGFGVVGVDGLKIEPLTQDVLQQPIRDIQSVTEDLNQRRLMGFGGVAEYGITVRWDKNFLKLIYLTLSRKQNFRVYGGVRFGGTITIEDAWQLGFDHIAMATGAGKPTIVKMKNNLIRGVRKASDFLMGLQLTGAFKKDTLANLQIRLPALVIGGGLTGVDTATEIFAYYPLQVEKILERYEVLVQGSSEQEVLSRLTAEDQVILKEFLTHGQEVRKERERAQSCGEAPNFVPLVRQWGGVNLVYRKSLLDAPAYRLNHEEVEKALEEGIYFSEKLSPVECHRDEFGALSAVSFEKQFQNEEGKWRGSGELVKFEARSLCVAAGTSPNTIYEKEFPGTFKMDEWRYFFQKHKQGEDSVNVASSDEVEFLTSYQGPKGQRISFYGDNHPDFAGNVVKAMASAKKGYPSVVSLFEQEIAALDVKDQSTRDQGFEDFVKTLDDSLVAVVDDVIRLTGNIVEVRVKAPLAARQFKPGQFYRLQNYEADATVIGDTKLLTEGMALTGAWVDPKQGLLSTIVLEMGSSSRLCATLKKGQRVVLMGPTGTPTEIPQNQTVLLAGGGLGNAVLFSIASALKQAGNRVLYFAGYKFSHDVFKREEIEAGTDVVVWSYDQGEGIDVQRKQDRCFHGNIVQAMLTYAKGELGDVPIPLNEVDRIIVIGSDRMMAAVKQARFEVLKDYLKDDHVAIGSINSSMQCMMKEVCAQCLQKHVDPKTGEETKPVFSCFNQDQCLDEVDFANLNERLQMNHLQEVLSGLWLDHLFSKQEVFRV